MKKTIKLKKNYEFQNTFKRGKYFSGKIIECYHLKNNKNVNYIGFAISSKIANAVKRNRIKRIFSEVYRNLEDRLKTGSTMVFLWKKKVKVEECSYSKVLADMIRIFNKIGILEDEENND